MSSYFPTLSSSLQMVFEFCAFEVEYPDVAACQIQDGFDIDIWSVDSFLICVLEMRLKEC